VTAIANGEQDRKILATAINVAQKSGAWKSRAIRPSRQIDPFIAEAVSTQKFQEFAVLLTDILLIYKFTEIILFPYLYTETRLAELKMGLNSPGVSLNDRQAMAREATELSGEHGGSVSRTAISEYYDLYRQHVLPLENTLKQIALDAVKLKQLEDIETEKAFNAEHGLNWEPGKLAKRRDSAVKQLQLAVTGVKAPPMVQVAQAIHRPEDSVLSTLFGIPFDPIALATCEPAAT
jgi:hypothetical protein